MTWKEHSIVSANDRVIDGFLNWVKYVFTADNLIQNIDVYVARVGGGNTALLQALSLATVAQCHCAPPPNTCRLVDSMSYGAAFCSGFVTC